MTIRINERKGLLEPLSIYIHVPFCHSKCPYCAFVSYRPGHGDIDDWLNLISKEFDFWTRGGSRKLRARTIYFGGGTPSVLSPSQWIRLFSIVEKNSIFLKDLEISVEANPDSLSPDLLDMWRTWGFSRVSIGVQSFNDDELRWLGRCHNSDQARRAIDLSLERSFQVSGDLMFGLSGQTIRKWHYNLHEMVKSGVHHVSIYQLMLEENSFWGNNPPEGVQNGYGHYRWSQWYLSRKGFSQYEIASFARDDCYCLHNRSYWDRTNVIGVGPAAWGYLDGVRYANISSFYDYSKSLSDGGSPVSYEETLSETEAASEEAILALRTKWGLDLDNYVKKFGESVLERFMTVIDEIPPDLVVFKDRSVALSPKGMRVANAIWERLLWKD